MSEIAIIDSNISQNSQLVKVYYIMEISITIVLSLIILIIQYYLLIWNLKVDEEATFRMIQFIPLQTINSNKNLFRTIQNHSTKEWLSQLYLFRTIKKPSKNDYLNILISFSIINYSFYIILSTKIILIILSYSNQYHFTIYYPLFNPIVFNL